VDKLFPQANRSFKWPHTLSMWSRILTQLSIIPGDAIFLIQVKRQST